MVNSKDGDIILDCQIKTCDGWVARVEFLHERREERAQSATALCKKDINDLHVELGNLSKSITHATANYIGVQVTSTFMLCKDYTLGKAKQQGVSKKAIALSKILGEKLFFDISSPSTPTFGSKIGYLSWMTVVIIFGVSF